MFDNLPKEVKYIIYVLVVISWLFIFPILIEFVFYLGYKYGQKSILQKLDSGVPIDSDKQDNEKTIMEIKI